MMGRLIDADKLTKALAECLKGLNGGFAQALSTVLIVSAQPTAYSVDEVVRKLKEEEEYSHADFEAYAEEHGLDSEEDWFYAGLKRAAEIVKGG